MLEAWAVQKWSYPKNFSTRQSKQQTHQWISNGNKVTFCSTLKPTKSFNSHSDQLFSFFICTIYEFDIQIVNEYLRTQIINYFNEYRKKNSILKLIHSPNFTHVYELLTSWNFGVSTSPYFWMKYWSRLISVAFPIWSLDLLFGTHSITPHCKVQDSFIMNNPKV